MYKKIYAGLLASAIGDAMGAVTETLTYNQIREQYPNQVKTFLRPPVTAHAAGNEPGEVTDDFSQLYYLAKTLLNSNEFSEKTGQESIIWWFDTYKHAKKFAGPTTMNSILRMKNDDTLKNEISILDSTIASRATNGGAMKIGPVGWFFPNNIDKTILVAAKIVSATHKTDLAISGACSIAAAVSMAMNTRATAADIIEAGIYGAKEGRKLGEKIGIVASGPDVTERIKLALSIVATSQDKQDALKKLYDIVGSGLHVSEAVPVSFGIIALNRNNLFEAITDSVNIGYDTDTVATIVGVILGTLNGLDDMILSFESQIEIANGFNLSSLAQDISDKISLKK